MRGAAGVALCLWACGALPGCAHQSQGLAESGDPVVLKRELAESLVTHGAYDAAVTPLKAVLARVPDDPEAHELLGVVYRERGLYDAAEQELRAAMKGAPGAAAPHADLGILYDLQGKHKQAQAEHRLATRLHPAVGAYWNNLGFSLYLDGRYREAIQAYLRALLADPGSKRTRNNLGFAYGRLGDTTTAMSEFKQGGTPAQAENNIGLVEEWLGDNVKACAHYDTALALDPDLTAPPRNRDRACSEPSRRGGRETTR